MNLTRLSLLIGALVFLALPSAGTAQAPRRVATPLQAAARALIEGRYAEVDTLTEKLDTRDPNVVALRARAAIARGRYADAEASLRPVVSRFPTLEAALQLGARCARALIGSARAVPNDTPPQAIALAKRALEANPSSVDADVFLAEEAIDAGRRDEASELLTKALEVNPSSLETHALLGAIAYVDDKSQQFDAEVAKTLAIAPNYSDVYR